MTKRNPDLRREYPERPIVGVGAVIINQGRVLLVKRGNPPLQGSWSLPGGVVEVGETLREATQREAHEETGLTVEAGEVIEVLDRIIRDQNGAGSVHYHYVLIDFLCRVRGGELLVGGDAAAAEWATENELKKFKLDKLAMDVVAKAFAMAKT